MNTSTLFELASASLILAVTFPTGLADTVLRALNVDHYRTAFGLGGRVGSWWPRPSSSTRIDRTCSR